MALQSWLRQALSVVVFLAVLLLWLDIYVARPSVPAIVASSLDLGLTPDRAHFCTGESLVLLGVDCENRGSGSR